MRVIEGRKGEPYVTIIWYVILQRVFFKLFNKKNSEDFKYVLKTVFFSLQVGLTSKFVSDCQTVLTSCKNQGLEKFSCGIRYKTYF